MAEAHDLNLEGEARPRSKFAMRGDGSLHDRVITAGIVLGVAAALTLLAGVWRYGGLVLVGLAFAILTMCCFEVARLFCRDPQSLRYRGGYGLLLFAALMAPILPVVVESYLRVIGAGTQPWELRSLTNVGVLCSLLLLVAAGKKSLEDAATFAQGVLPAMLLVSICGSSLLVLAAFPAAYRYMWWLVGLVALNDIAAYFGGRVLKGPKLAPFLSPNKTLSGSLCGMIAGVGFGVLTWDRLVVAGVPVYYVAFLSALMVLLSQAGDLIKPYVKRLRGVKDTGAILPGHGGALDRFDGFLAASPLFVGVLFVLGL